MRNVKFLVCNLITLKREHILMPTAKAITALNNPIQAFEVSEEDTLHVSVIK